MVSHHVVYQLALFARIWLLMICEQPFGVACEQGLTPPSKVVVPGDGAKGLREAVLLVFPQARYFSTC
jgi:hypothetical protein